MIKPVLVSIFSVFLIAGCVSGDDPELGAAQGDSSASSDSTFTNPADQGSAIPDYLLGLWHINDFYYMKFQSSGIVRRFKQDAAENCLNEEPIVAMYYRGNEVFAMHDVSYPSADVIPYCRADSTNGRCDSRFHIRSSDAKLVWEVYQADGQPSGSESYMERVDSVTAQDLQVCTST